MSDVKRTELEAIRIGVLQRVSLDLLGLDASVVVDELAHQIELCLRGYLWGREKEIASVRWPKDWKGAFKERWFPRWLLRRYPVLYEHRRFDAYAVFPDLRLEMPDRRAYITISGYSDSRACGTMEEGE